MSETFDTVVLGVALLALLPALLAGGGFIIAIVAALLVVSGAYGGRYTLRVVEQRHVGAKQAAIRDQFRTTDDASDREAK